jgi:hypothetical protein
MDEGGLGNCLQQYLEQQVPIAGKGGLQEQVLRVVAPAESGYRKALFAGNMFVSFVPMRVFAGTRSSKASFCQTGRDAGKDAATEGTLNSPGNQSAAYCFLPLR